MDMRFTFIAVVLLSALIVAFESVSVEGALNIADLDVFLVTSVPVIVGGLILIGISFRGTVSFAKGLGFRGWTSMAILCVFVSAGVLLWFDSVGRIGASKEAILGGGSSEVLFIVILSALFLSERLNKWEAIGSVMIVVGVFVVLANTETMSLTIGFGEIEAIMSSLILGISVVLTTHLLRSHELTPLSAVELILSGAMMLVVGAAAGFISWPENGDWALLLALGIFPAFGLLTYNAGLPKIGASLTSVLFALTGIMTVGVELAVMAMFPDADMILPQDLGLAVLGGSVAFVGVYLLNVGPSWIARRLPGEER